MRHRSMPPRVLDDGAFPIRVKVRVPPQGFGPVLIEILRWLRSEVGEGNFARHEAERLEGEALALHFRQLRDASALLCAFPQLELADKTSSRAYLSPLRPKRRAVQ